jgi:predicted DsbA family dithiol-disulfide isomerase
MVFEMARSKKTRVGLKEGVVNETESAVKAEVKAPAANKAAVKASSDQFSVNFSVNKVLTVLLALSIVTIVYLYTNMNKPGDVATVTGGVVGVPNTTQNSGTQPADSQGNYGNVNLEFYVMSKCPYGLQVENAIKPALDKLGKSVTFTLNYIANENANGTYSSLHGQSEVDGDMIQLCAARYYPSKYMDFIVCQNKDVNTIQSFNSCATESGLDASKIEACFKGEEGKRLMSASIMASTSANARGSPTIKINGAAYSGARDSLSFTRALCTKLNNHPECASIPACGGDQDCTAESDKDGRCVNGNQSTAKCEYSTPVQIELVVVNAADCASCDSSNIVSVSKQLFKGLRVKNVEYASDEGKQLFEKYSLRMLPGYIFDSNVTWSPSYVRVQRSLTKVGDKYVIQPSAAGSTYNPTLVEIPRKLDLFVMSQCPYGAMAEQNLAEVLSLFGSSINFTLRFIADETSPGAFTSMHGNAEVEEDLRQVCAIKYSPDKYFNYVLCIDKNYSKAGSIWESCASQTGLDVEKIRACYSGEEGKKLLSENIKLTNELGIGSSPTFLINGKQQVGGAMPANTIKDNICKANVGLAGCEKTLSGGSATGAAIPAGGCG